MDNLVKKSTAHPPLFKYRYTAGFPLHAAASSQRESRTLKMGELSMPVPGPASHKFRNY